MRSNHLFKSSLVKPLFSAIVLLLSIFNSWSVQDVFEHKVLYPDQESVLTEQMEFINNTPDFRVKFTQENYVQALNRTFTSQGELYLLRDEGIVWKTETPYNQTLYIANTGEVFDPDSDSSNRPFPHAQAMVDIFNSDLHALSKAFSLFFLAPQDHWILGLRPSRRLIRRHLDEIVIIGNYNGEIYSIDISIKDGSPIQFSFEGQEPLGEKEKYELRKVFQKQ